MKVCDETIRVLKSAVRKAPLGQDEEPRTLGRLDEEARRLVRLATGPAAEQPTGPETAHPHRCGGRSVFGWEPPAAGADAGAKPRSRRRRRR